MQDMQATEKQMLFLMLELTKGKRYSRIKVEYLQDFDDRPYTH